MDDQKNLNDVFPGWFSGSGIFSALQRLAVPWADENISASLDMEYHGNKSGEKYISPLLQKLISGDIATPDEITKISNVIVSIFGANWSKQWATQSFDYNPIENYSMTEKMLDDKTVTEYGKLQTRTANFTHGKTGTDTQTPNTTEKRTDNLIHGKTGTDTQTPNTTETQTPNLTNVSENTVHGFNSSQGVPVGEMSQKSTGVQETTRTGTDKTEYNTQETDTGTQETTRTGTEKIEYNTQETDMGTQTENDSGADTNTRNYQLTRSGNIGVTTSQQMIESERNIWIWNFFHDVVFPDIDRVLTIQIY